MNYYCVDTDIIKYITMVKFVYMSHKNAESNVQCKMCWLLGICVGVSIHWTGLLDWHIFGFYKFQGHIFGFTYSKFLLSLKDLIKTFSLLQE